MDEDQDEENQILTHRVIISKANPEFLKVTSHEIFILMNVTPHNKTAIYRQIEINEMSHNITRNKIPRETPQ